MLILTSPAKTLDFNSPFLAPFQTQPGLLKEATVLMEYLKKISKEKLAKTLQVSSEIADKNYERFQQWQPQHTLQNSRPAIVAYAGIIYQQIHENEYSESQSVYAQDTLRIISGLYGALRPYDLIQPYRLEMKVRLQTAFGKTLYQFWGEKVIDLLNKDIVAKDSAVVLNLASEEYAKVVTGAKLKAPLINVVFNQRKNNKIYNFGLHARKARGMMIDYMIKNQIYDIKQLENFTVDEYRFTTKTPTTLFFLKEL